MNDDLKAARLKEAERAFHAYSSNYPENISGAWNLSRENMMTRQWVCDGASVTFCVEFEHGSSLLQDMYRIDLNTGSRIDQKYALATNTKPNFDFNYHPALDFKPRIRGCDGTISLLEIVYSHYKRSAHPALIGDSTQDFIGHYPLSKPLDFDKVFQLYYPRVQFFPERQPSLAQMVIQHFEVDCEAEQAMVIARSFIMEVARLEKISLGRNASLSISGPHP